MTENNAKKVIVIGGGIAAINVIYQLIKANQTFNITCITQEKFYDYSTCGMPYVLEGVTKNIDDIILHTPEFFSEKGVTVLVETEATDIDFTKHQVIIRNNENQNKQLEYDYLVIATGRLPFKPPIKGINLPGVHTLMNLEHCKQIQSRMMNVKSAVVIGGGAIGLEVALAFNAHKIKTTVVELTPSVLPVMLDPDMGKLVEDWLTTLGIQILTSSKVQEITGDQHVASIVIEDGTELPANLVLLSTGIRPNVALAKAVGLDLGPVGGIRVDGKQKAFLDGQLLENVFALGDCVETPNLITGAPIVCALASMAIVQARAITNNILGKASVPVTTVNPALTYLAGLQVGTVGLTAYAAKKARIAFKTATGQGKSQSRYIPSWKNIHFKFLANGDKLIGAQIIGERDVKERINALTLAIRENISISTLLQTERCYTPPLALLTDPMFKALEQLI